MRSFPHGITRPFLRTVWAHLAPCLGLDLLLKGGAEHKSLAEYNLHSEEGSLLPFNGEDDGDLRPTTGDENEAEINLQPNLQGGHEEEKAEINLQTTALINGQDQAGVLPLMSGDDEAKSAANLDLRPPLQGGKYEEEKGCPPPSNGEEDQQSEIKIVANAAYINLQPPQGEDDGFILLQRGDDLSKQLRWAFVDGINAWVMPIPRPRVKMKGEMLLYNAHAWEHDAWVIPSSPSNSSINSSLAVA